MAADWKDIAHYQVPTDDSFRLKHQNPDFTGEIAGKKQAAELLQGGVEQLAELQDVLYADGRWGCLLYTSPSPRDQRGSRMPSSA